MPLSIFNLEFATKYKTSISNSMLFALSAAQVLAYAYEMVRFVAAKISNCEMYQLFSHMYISWDKYHYTPILLMVVLFSKPFVGSIFKQKHDYSSHALKEILDKDYLFPWVSFVSYVYLLQCACLVLPDFHYHETC